MKQKGSRFTLVFTFVILLATACVPHSEPVSEIQVSSTPATQADPTASPVALTPAGSLFSSLPLYAPGETVEQGEYAIHLDGVQINAPDQQLDVSITITNHSASSIDLGWAIQLRDAQGGYVTGEQSQASVEKMDSLEAGSSLAATWSYPLATNAEGQSLNDISAYQQYYLVFAPRGWSGPVTVFRLIP